MAADVATRDQCTAAAFSCVREFLARKGLDATLAALDKEAPRDAGSINSRNELLRTLNIGNLMRKNLSSANPLSSVLETVSNFLIEKKRQKKALSTQPGSSSSSASTSPEVDHPAMSAAAPAALAQNQGKPGRKEARQSSSRVLPRPPQMGETGSPHRLSSRELRGRGRGPGGRSSFGLESGSDAASPQHSPRNQRRQRSSGMRRPSNDVADAGQPPVRPSSAAVSGLRSRVTTHDRPSSSVTKGPKSRTTGLAQRGAQPVGRDTNPAKAKAKVSAFGDSSSDSDGIGAGIASLVVEEKKPVAGAPDRSVEQAAAQDAGGMAMEEIGVEDMAIEDMSVEEFGVSDYHAPGTTSSVMKGPKSGSSFGGGGGGGAVGKGRSSMAIDMKTAAQLRTLMFGDKNGTWNDKWTVQNFAFTTNPGLEYGLVQKEGGSCGVMAVVQAFVVKHLLANGRFAPDAMPNAADQKSALVLALAEILWLAGDKKVARIALPGKMGNRGGVAGYKADGITERLSITEFVEYDDMVAYLRKHTNDFMSDTRPSCITFVYSAILTRGIAKVRSDMDDPKRGRLMGAHGYCTQELCNLLMTGRAKSNVFNGEKRLGEGEGPDVMVLGGIESQCEIGMLSLFEHYKSLEVGSHMKNPTCPIWVIFSQSHYSLMFSFAKTHQDTWDAEFDVYYYDQLANQNDIYRITIDPKSTDPIPDEDEVLVSEIEHCLRTRWNGAGVDWNGKDGVY